MSVSFQTGQTLSRGDLDLFLTNAGNVPANAFSITFALYFVDPATGLEVLIGSATRTPVNPAVGEYFAAIQVPPNATPGDYRIRWTFKETAVSPDQVVVQEFSVVAITCDASTNLTTTYSACVSDLIQKLRYMTRDHNPDRYYRFRPPTGEGVIGCYNQVNGFIWEDAELYEYLEIALWKWNTHPPETESLSNLNALCSQKPIWRAPILWGALVNAAQALAYNWVSEEFSVVGETLVQVRLPDGRFVDLPIQELYHICKDGGSGHSETTGGSTMIDSKLRQDIRAAFLEGDLQVATADPATGEIFYAVISDVLKHHTPHKSLVRVICSEGSVDTTIDHSLFQRKEGRLTPVQAGELKAGDTIVTLTGDSTLEAVVPLPPTPFTYDLSVPGPENFFLSNGILAHNSYSIGGISLDIDRSSKYMDLKRNAEEQWDKMVEAKARTTKYIRGLQQPRFGRGVRSAFGPNVGRGVLSPRNFLVVFLCCSGADIFIKVLHSLVGCATM